MTDRDLTGFSICRYCLNVREIGFPAECESSLGRHDWIPAAAWDCPYMKRSGSGRLSSRARAVADAQCRLAPGAIHLSHHYGDLERRHFAIFSEHQAAEAS